MDLKGLQKKARSNLKQEANKNIIKGHRKRPSVLRICIWLAEIVILFLIVEHFILSPRSEDPAPATPRLIDKSGWDEAALLGPNALDLKGLTEAKPIYLPPTANLAAGSRSTREAQLVVARDKKLPVEVVNSVGMRFRLIPQGSFMMGSPADEAHHWEGEKQHLVHINQPFYIGKTEVTQAQWQAVMGADANPSGFKGDERPVENVSWYECQRFLMALNEKEELPEWTYRLPTEAQWEYAARAGTETAYYFGDDPERLRYYAWYDANSFGTTHAVAHLWPNAFGLYDMLGNVWEWCWNTYKPYPESPEKPRDDLDWTRIRVIRGGNWRVGAKLCRVANRARLGPDSKGNMLGFRVVRFIHEIEGSEEPPPPSGSTPPSVNDAQVIE